jgi:hypothetical protein
MTLFDRARTLARKYNREHDQATRAGYLQEYLQEALTKRPLVDYHVMREALPIPPSTNGEAYDYMFGSDGVFIAARSELLYARVPVAFCHIRGLQPVGMHLSLVHGKIPAELWDDLLLVFDAAREQNREALAAIAHDGSWYSLVLPDQDAQAWRVAYAPRDGWVFEVHSHREAAARFSIIDTNDEQRFRLYGVVGVYGHFMPVLWSEVFDGNPEVVDDVSAIAVQLWEKL